MAKNSLKRCFDSMDVRAQVLGVAPTFEPAAALNLEFLSLALRLKHCCIAIEEGRLRCIALAPALRLLNALNSEDRGLKARFSLAMIVFETFELILCQMLSSQGKNAPSNPYPHYLVRLATSRLERERESTPAIPLKTVTSLNIRRLDSY